MLVSKRKNKTYTSIILKEISECAFLEALELYNTLDGHKIIKPSKKAFQSFLKLHSLTLDKLKSGEDYNILGTTFKIVRELNDSDSWYPIVRYFDRNQSQYKELGLISNNNFASNVLETCFQNKTGKLLYF